MKRLLPFFFLTLTSFSLFAQVDEQDSLALVALYESTDGDNWTNNDNWLEGPVKDWFGVGFVNGSLFQLFMDNNNLVGEIPPDIGELKTLSSLSLSGNLLSGRIPKEIADMDTLYYLMLNDNLLEGPLPKEMGSMKRIGAVFLENNNISGQIPEEFGGMNSLSGLLIKNNNLQGIVPDSFWGLKNISTLDLSNNNLTGQIPEDIGNQQELGRLYLNDNQFYGKLPDSFLTLESLVRLDLSNTEICEPTSQTWIDWKDELIYAKTSGLTCYDLESDSLAVVALYESTNGDNWTNNENWLEGPVESWYGVGVNDDRVRILALEQNNLSGPLPEELGNLTSLVELNLYSNALTGHIPDLGQLSFLSFLSLGDNQLTGPIPYTLGYLNSLWYLDLSENSLSGEIPSTIWQLSQLRGLTLFENHLSGQLSPDIDNLGYLEYLFLSDNELSGAIPATLGELSNLWDLEIANNEFTGQIPVELGQLSNLEFLRLDGNRLTGSLPAELSLLKELLLFAVFDNLLTGAVPESYASMVDLFSFYIQNNALLCEPTSISYLEWIQNLGEFDNSGTCVQEEIPEREKDSLALVALYESTNGDNWTNNDNWLEGPLESWYGIVSIDYRVGAIYLGSNNLTGSLPAEIGNLLRIHTFDFHNNQLEGPIPSGITNILELGKNNPDSAVFDFSNTSLCEPTNQDYLEWKEGRNIVASGVLCSDEAELLQFAIEQQVGEADIDQVERTISITVDGNADLESLIPTFSVSPGATVETCTTESISLPASKDAQVYSLGLGGELGLSKPDIVVAQWTTAGQATTNFGLVNFDMASVPSDANIVNAVMSLYCDPTKYPYNPTLGHSQLSGSNAALVQRATSEWSELVNWTSKPSFSNINQVTIPASQTNTQDYPSIDVTQLVIDMHENPENSNGFRIQMEVDEPYRLMMFASSEHPNPDLHPRLEIEYETNLSSVKVQSGATALDFTSPICLRVISSDLSTSETWTVNVELETSDDTEILQFSIDDQIGETVIDTENREIEIFMPSGSDLSSLVPDFGLAAGATLQTCEGASMELISSKDGMVFSLDPSGTRDRGLFPDFAISEWTHEGVRSSMYALIDFDLSSAPDNAVLQDAKMYLFNSPISNSLQSSEHTQLIGTNAATIQRITSPWEESVSWSQLPGTTNINQVLLPASVNPRQDYEVNVSELIIDALSYTENSYGFLIKMLDPNPYKSLIFASRENENLDLRPTLSVDFGGIELQSGVTELNFTSPVCLEARAANGFTSTQWTVTVSVVQPSSVLDFLSFSISEQIETAYLDPEQDSVGISVACPEGFFFTPTFSLAEGIEAYVNGALQESDVSEQDFSETVLYTLIDEAGKEAVWEVTITDQSALSTVNLTSDANYSCAAPNGGAVVYDVEDSQGNTFTTFENYSFEWSADDFANVLGTDYFLSNQTPGDYQLRVTEEQTGCQITESFSIVDSTQIYEVAAVVSAQTDCAVPNGAIGLGIIEVFGLEYELPDARFSILWHDDNSTSVERTGLIAGSYEVQILDNETGCIYDQAFSILNNTLGGTIQLASSDVTSCVTNNGYASASVDGSVSGYEFSWYQGSVAGGSVIGTSASVSGLAPGTYTVQVNIGDETCYTSKSVSVGSNLPILDVTRSATVNENCKNPNGSVLVTAIEKDGVLETDYFLYDIVWSDQSDLSNPISDDEVVKNLTPGRYYVQATEKASGCQSPIRAIILNDAAVLPTFTISAVPNTLCGDSGNGSAIINELAAGQTVAWYAGDSETAIANETSASIDNLTAGSYRAEVTTTATGCSSTQSFSIADTPGSVSLVATANNNTSCEVDNGAVAVASITVNGTTTEDLTAFTIHWSASEDFSSTLSDTENLAAGTYYVKASLDSTGCTSATAAATIADELPQLAVSLTESSLDQPGPEATGSLAIAVSGSSNYAAAWYAGESAIGEVLSTNDTLENQQDGVYTVLITDESSGCTTTATFDIELAPEEEEEAFPQTISFEPPESIFQDELPLILEASSDQDLMISYEIVEGEGTIEGTMLTTATPGTLTISASNVGNDSIMSASAEATIEINGNYELSGTINPLSNGSPINATMILLAPDGIVLADTAIDEDNSFSFDNLREGLYYLLAEVNGASNAAAFDTYFEDAVFWGEATGIALTANEDITINLVEKPTTSPQGNGKIRGTIVLGNGGSRIVTGRTLDGEPLADVDVYLLEAGTNAIVAQATTNENGAFEMTGIASGNYRFRVDLVGAEIADLSTAINFDEDAGELIISAVVEVDGLEAEFEIVSVTSVEELQSQIRIFPNPAEDWFTIESSRHIVTDIQMINLVGQQIRSFTPTARARYDVSGLKQGVYFIRIQLASEEVLQIKIKIQ